MKKNEKTWRISPAGLSLCSRLVVLSRGRELFALVTRINWVVRRKRNNTRGQGDGRSEARGKSTISREDTVGPSVDREEDWREHIPNDGQRVILRVVVHRAEVDALPKVLRLEDLVVLSREVVELAHGHRRKRMLRGEVTAPVIDAKNRQARVPEEVTGVRIASGRPVDVPQAAQRCHILDNPNLREIIDTVALLNELVYIPLLSADVSLIHLRERNVERFKG